MVWEGESGLVQERFDRRTNYLFAVFFVCAAVIFLRVFYLQVLRGRHFYALSEQNRTYMYIERAPRGIIYDTKGVVLCGNRPVVTALFYPFMRSKSESVIDELIARIEKILPGSRQKVMDAMRTSTVVALKENLAREETFRILEQQRNLKGVSVVTEMKRYYPFGERGSHFLGYIGEISRQELNEPRYIGYRQGDRIGKTGIEAQYDAYVRGVDGGLLIESDALGRQVRVVKKIDAVPGDKVLLTIDSDLQNTAELALEETGRSGAIVGIDPRDGAVRILVSRPGFDPKRFIIGGPDVSEYFTKKTLPMYNRACQAQYPPGSVFKIVTSAAALNEGAVDPRQTFNCPGYFVLGNKTFKCWKEKGHGIMSFLPGVMNSCDVYFYNVGLKTGIDDMAEYAERFHLGRTLKIDLPSESPGFIPTAKWRKTAFMRKWMDGDTVNIAIGQGYITVTPLQCATMIAAIATRGDIYSPYLVDRILDNSGNKIYGHAPVKIDNVDLKEDVWDIIQQALEGVVERGTGHAAYVEGMRIAGKTGTAQNPHGRDHAWFVAYGPVENPELALTVLVEFGGMGGAVAAPIAQRIFTRLKEIRSTGTN
jgi:penicillin-binding protein 2